MDRLILHDQLPITFTGESLRRRWIEDWGFVILGRMTNPQSGDRFQNNPTPKSSPEKDPQNCKIFRNGGVLVSTSVQIGVKTEFTVLTT